MMKTFLILMPLTVFFLISCQKKTGQESSTRKPNFIVIVFDDLDFDEVNFYNMDYSPCYYSARKNKIKNAVKSAWEKTGFFMPNIDKLAGNGAVFTRFYANSSVCTPVRYALLTGRQAYESPFISMQTPNGEPAFIRWNSFISPDERTIVDDLHDRNYVAAFIGKWHNGANFKPILIPYSPEDFNDSLKYQRIRKDYAYIQKFLTDSLRWDYADRIFYDNPAILNLEWMTEGVIRFLDSYKDKPFFLYLPLPFPHAQYYDFKNWDPLMTPAGILEKAPESGHSYPEAKRKNKLHFLPDAFSMATYIDDFIGVILNKLKEYGIDENTMIIFTSDQQTRGKYTCYETCRVPTFIYYPPLIKPKTKIHELCLITDIYPTVLSLIDKKEVSIPGSDSRSLIALLSPKKNSGKIPWRQEIYLEISYSKAIVTKDYKYIANRPPLTAMEKMKADEQRSKNSGTRRKIGWDGMVWGWNGLVYNLDLDFPAYFDADQLFDLNRDVFEQRNLAYLPEYQNVVNEMKLRLKNKMSNYPFKFGEFSEEKRTLP
ncbi:MAG: sulfatase-like hydrolase/transferase [Sphingobacteriales bacterium]|nr:sulfatase-like hydrolase/transferase [Sphingobacteriales bacterium]